MNDAYDQGFIEKCAERGVDPEAVIKHAQFSPTGVASSVANAAGNYALNQVKPRAWDWIKRRAMGTVQNSPDNTGTPATPDGKPAATPAANTGGGFFSNALSRASKGLNAAAAMPARLMGRGATADTASKRNPMGWLPDVFKNTDAYRNQEAKNYEGGEDAYWKNYYQKHDDYKKYYPEPAAPTPPGGSSPAGGAAPWPPTGGATGPVQPGVNASFATGPDDPRNQAPGATPTPPAAQPKPGYTKPPSMFAQPPASPATPAAPSAPAAPAKPAAPATPATPKPPAAPATPPEEDWLSRIPEDFKNRYLANREQGRTSMDAQGAYDYYHNNYSGAEKPPVAMRTITLANGKKVQVGADNYNIRQKRLAQDKQRDFNRARGEALVQSGPIRFNDTAKREATRQKARAMLARGNRRIQSRPIA